MIRKHLSRRPEVGGVTELRYRRNWFIIFFTGCREWQGQLAWHSVNQKCLSISRVYERFCTASALQCTTLLETRQRERERHFMTVELKIEREGSRDVALTVGFCSFGPVHFLSCQTHNLKSSGPKTYLDTEVALQTVWILLHLTS